MILVDFLLTLYEFIDLYKYGNSKMSPEMIDNPILQIKNLKNRKIKQSILHHPQSLEALQSKFLTFSKNENMYRS